MARIRVIVKPASSRREVRVAGDAVLVRVTAPPAEGRANEMCLALLADWLGLPKSRLTIVSGARRKEKVVEVAGLSEMDLEKRLRGAGGAG